MSNKLRDGALASQNEDIIEKNLVGDVTYNQGHDLYNQRSLELKICV